MTEAFVYVVKPPCRQPLFVCRAQSVREALSIAAALRDIYGALVMVTEFGARAPKECES